MQTQPTACERDLEKLRARLIHMSTKVRAMVLGSVQALTERNSELALALIASDRDINRLEMATDQLCLRILAKRQPVASELRSVALCVKMVTDLERIGDLAVHICEEVIALNEGPTSLIDPELPQLGSWVEEMVHVAMDAFVARDADAARRVLADDDRVDAGFETVFRRHVLALMHDTSGLSIARSLQAIATHLERIGDHATNLAEMVIFMVEGTDVRHLRTYRA